MPRRVDHEIRRTEIATAVARIARARGLQGVSFREVAAEAGLSVALVQHYFGSKDGLLIGTLDIESVRLARAIRDRLDRLDPRASPRARLQVIASAFLPTDDDTRDAMLVYHAFAAAALTDAGLRRAEAFRNADRLVDAIADELARARERGELARGVQPTREARALLALLLGLSLGVLLEQTDPDDAAALLDSHMQRLLPPTR